MSPKEKSLELFKLFNSYQEYERMDGYFNAKQCALICVDEVIDQWEYIDTYISDFGGKLNPNLKYWLEVKQELLKL